MKLVKKHPINVSKKLQKDTISITEDTTLFANFSGISYLERELFYVGLILVRK